VGTTVSVYALARLIMNVPAGIMGDRHGRKPLLVWGPAITAIGHSPLFSLRPPSCPSYCCQVSPWGWEGLGYWV